MTVTTGHYRHVVEALMYDFDEFGCWVCPACYPNEED